MNSTRTLILFSMMFLFITALSPAQDIEKVWETGEGIERPESTYYDAQRDQIYVSNIAGGGTDKDGEGWISILDTDGSVIEKKWVDGLNAPKGIRATGNTLWVSDIDRILGYELSTGEQVAEVSVPDAVFLNDVAVGHDGTVYVSDMRDNKIYSYKDGNLEVFAEGKKLENPNGLLVSGTRLLAGGWSTGENQAGHLYSLDLRTGEKRLITPEPTAHIDGLELDGRGNYLISDWPGGTVSKITPEGKKKTLLELEKGTADIGYIREKQLLLLPYMTQNKVLAYRLGSERNYKDLIDQDLSKWQTEGNWNVTDDGTVALKPGPEEEGWKRFEDYLTSKKKYGDFELHVEYKFQDGGNSGVFFRIGNSEEPVDTGIEAQILDSYDKTDDLGPHDHGGIIGTSGPDKNMSRPAGHWNHMTVICEGNHLRVILNGEQIQDLQLDESAVSDRPSTGHVSIQDHGQPFWVRNVKIRVLD